MSLHVKHIYLLLSLVLVLLFQNCGADYAPSSLYDNNGTGNFYSDDCISQDVNCGPRNDRLLVSITTPDPLVIPYTNTFYMISGRCNTGNYPEHQITYEVLDAGGVRRLNEVMVGLCVGGKYQFNISLNPLVNNVGHTLIVNIIGIDSEGRSFSSSQSGGSAQIDFSKQ